MRQHGFNFIRRVVVEQRVCQDDSSCIAQPGQGRVGLLALFRQPPAIDTSYSGPSSLSEHHETSPQFFIFERFKFIKDRKQHYWRQLCQQYEQSHEQNPSQHPPVLRPLTDREIQQLHNDSSQNEAHQKSLGFIPQPRAEFLVRELKSTLQAKTVVV